MSIIDSVDTFHPHPCQKSDTLPQINPNWEAAFTGGIQRIFRKLVDLEVELVDWETSIVPGMGLPQNVVNKAAKYKDCDIFIGMFWSKFGTPTGNFNPETGLTFKSGTEEEFFEAYQAWGQRGRPRIHFYRCCRALPSSVDPVQLMALNDFFKAFSPTGANPGMYKSFTNSEDFVSSVEDALFSYIKEITQFSSSDKPTRVNLTLENFGVRDFCDPQFNEVRNLDKKSSLNEAKWGRLLAYGGHSYIASHSHRFRDEVEGLLSRSCPFKVVILNPWCEWSFLKALSYDARKPEFGDIRKYSRSEAIRIIKDSTPYRVTLQNSLLGYAQLKRKFGRRISIKMTNYPMEYTTLITDKDCYIEPYLVSAVFQRAQKNFNTFEVRFSSASVMHKNLVDEFDHRYKTGIPIEELTANETVLVNEICDRFGLVD